MKKLVLAALAAAGVVVARKKLAESGAERNAWHQATDPLPKA
ncbi:DLW-39 family protein [Nocardioides sp.]